MKKRIACFILTLIMLVSLVPTAAISASAASYTVSEAAITVMKKMTKLRTTCYQVSGDSSEFRIGYGTVCSEGKHNMKKNGNQITITFYDEEDEKIGEKVIAAGDGKLITYKDEKGRETNVPCEHKISEKQADALLRESLAELDKNVDSFASSNGISLSQRQHDALVVLTYGVGSAWMNGTSAVKTALKSGASASELLAAIAKTYSVDPTNENHYIVERAKIVVNMYANGIYSNVVPSVYSVVTYDANGGKVAGGETYKFYFDASKATGHPVVPTMNGQTFTGWYLLEKDGSYRLVEKLNGDCIGKTLYARWQKADSVAAGQIIEIKDLATWDDRIWTYEGPSEEGTASELSAEYKRISISKTFVDGEGNKWVQIGSGKTLYRDYSENVDGDEAWVDSDWYAKRWVRLADSVSKPVEYVTSVFSVSELKSRDLYNAPSTSSDSKKDLDKTYTHVKTNMLYVDSKGVRWARIGADDYLVVSKDGKTYKKNVDANGKWVIVKTGSNGGVSIGAADGAIAKATVTYAGGYVNVRSGAGTGYPIVGSVRNGETLDVFEIKTANGHKWGRISAGWFCLTYANVIMLGNSSDPDISSEGALAYTYSATINAESVEAFVTSSTSSNNAPYDEQLTNDTAVTVTNMTKTSDGSLWVKIRWKATYNQVSGGKETTKETTASGWVQLNSETLSLRSTPVKLSGAVRYTVAADEITVREEASSGANAVFKMYKGVEFTVAELKMDKETLWGRTAEQYDVNDKYEDENGDDSSEYWDGWVNLSNKYVSRTSLPAVTGGNSSLTPIGKTATIVNTDSVRVRICAGLYGRQLGTLPRGTTANILEIDDGWYNLDIDVDNDPKTGSWVFEDYVQVNDGYVASNGTNTTTVNNPDGTKTTTTTVGKGIVANTYSGVNFRSGAGIGHALLGKLLPGTVVDILETKNAGAAKWGRVNAEGKEGWVCMDYITMISSTTTTTTTTTGNGTGVKDFGTIDKTTTTAVYTGSLHDVYDSDTAILNAKAVADGETGKYVWATPKHNQDPAYAVRPLTNGSDVTIYELLEVTEVVWIDNETGDIVDEENDDFDYQDNVGDHGDEGSFSKETLVSYWARTSDGYIYNPQVCINLDPLDEQVHTLTGSDTLKVRDVANGSEIGELEKGDQVKVTSLEIINDKVWGKIEYGGDDTNNGIGTGWVRLDYMSEGAYFEEKVTETQTNTTNNGGTAGTTGGVGNTGNTGGGFTNNAGGYRYTGKVINTNAVNVRQTASQTAALTTTLKNGASLVIYETTISENMAWGRCDAGWVYLYYVDLTPVTAGLVDARVVYNDNTIIYSDSNGSSTVGTYARMSVIDIYEIVGKMAKTDQGWVNTDNLL